MEDDSFQFTRGILNVQQNLRSYRSKLKFLTPEILQQIKEGLDYSKMAKILAPVMATERLVFDVKPVLQLWKKDDVTVESLTKRHGILSECMESFAEAHVTEKVQYFVLLYILDEAERLSK